MMNTVHTSLTELGQQFHEEVKHASGTTFAWLVANKTADKVALLIHGVTGNKLDMVVVGSEFVKRGYAVYAPDLPGHGSAPALDAKSFNELGDWLRDCIQTIGRTPDVIVGNSFASGICYNFAAQGYLNKNTHLILSCPTPTIGWSSRALRRASGILPPKFATNAYNSRPAIATRVAYLGKINHPSAKKWLRESEYHKIPFIDATVGNRMSTLLDTHNPYHAPPLPPEVQKQITVIIGAKDNVITRRSLPYLRRILPLARMMIVPKVGHILHFEAPEYIAAAHKGV
jgi:pimeloyl-ACP methyl ester carboxylesterase